MNTEKMLKLPSQFQRPQHASLSLHASASHAPLRGAFHVAHSHATRTVTMMGSMRSMHCMRMGGSSRSMVVVHAKPWRPLMDDVDRLSRGEGAKVRCWCYTYICVCLCLCMCVLVCLCMCVCLCEDANADADVDACLRMQLCVTCAIVFVYLCVYARVR